MLCLIQPGWCWSTGGILTHRSIIPTSPYTLILKFSQSFQTSSNIQCWSEIPPAADLKQLSRSVPVNYFGTASPTEWHVPLPAGNGFHTWRSLSPHFKEPPSHLTTRCLPLHDVKILFSTALKPFDLQKSQVTEHLILYVLRNAINPEPLPHRAAVPLITRYLWARIFLKGHNLL